MRFLTFFNGIALMNKTPVRRENNRLTFLGLNTGMYKRRLATFKVVRQIQYNRYFPVIFLSTSNSPLVVVEPVMLTRLILNYA